MPKKIKIGTSKRQKPRHYTITNQQAGPIDIMTNRQRRAIEKEALQREYEDLLDSEEYDESIDLDEQVMGTYLVKLNKHNKIVIIQNAHNGEEAIHLAKNGHYENTDKQFSSNAYTTSKGDKIELISGFVEIT